MKKTEENNRNFSAMMIVVMLSILFVVMGALMTFLSGMESVYFCYVMAGFFLLGGAWLSIRYFVKEEYLHITNYDFSFGILMLISGVLLCVRAKDLLPGYFVLLGILLLVEAVFLLQFAIMTKTLQGGEVWLVILLFSLLVAGLSLFVLLKTDYILSNTSLLKKCYIGVMIAGILGLVSFLIVGFMSRSYGKKMAVISEEKDDRKEKEIKEVEEVRKEKTEELPLKVNADEAVEEKPDASLQEDDLE
ncbi:Short repeat of unknown function [Lachnospiraceae bacterium KHCPX20]|nr:Short repeat of unknown function [Lachnospiraceae bacterium KHCPX20]